MQEIKALRHFDTSTSSVSGDTTSSVSGDTTSSVSGAAVAELVEATNNKKGKYL